MADLTHSIDALPDGSIGVALCPQTNADARETGVWINRRLHQIHEHVRRI